MPDARTVRSKSLHHVALATRDAEATYAFYTGILRMPLVHTEVHRQGEGSFRHFFFDLGDGSALAFFEVDGVGERPDYSTRISTGLGLPIWVNHVAFRLDSLDELRAMRQRLQDGGVESLREIDHGWAQSLYAVDPNGILVEFCVTTDAERFAQTEAEALRLLRLPADQIGPETRKQPGDAPVT